MLGIERPRVKWLDGWKWTVAGSYQVKLTVTDNDGLRTSVLIPVTVR
jgi:hypothetical protein